MLSEKIPFIPICWLLPNGLGKEAVLSISIKTGRFFRERIQTNSGVLPISREECCGTKSIVSRGILLPM